MMTLGAFLLGIVGPLGARLLTALGLTLVVTTGSVAAATSIKALVSQHIGGLPADVIALAGLMGVWESFGIVFGAVSFVVGWSASAGFVRLAKA